MKVHPVVSRFFLVMIVSLAFGWLVSEAAYLLGKEKGRDVPGKIELVIPAGTAEKVAAGESSPSLPENMVFLQGDVLVVRNDDHVDHQLGPVWVPARSSGSLALNQANQYTMACSFQPSQNLGIDVRPLPTAWTRMQGIVSVGLPTGVLAWVYSLVLKPVKKDKELEVLS